MRSLAFDYAACEKRFRSSESFHWHAWGLMQNLWSMQLDDRFGSPMLEEIEAFSRSFQAALEAELGEDAAGAISLEVSSPVRSAILDHAAVHQTAGTLLPGRRHLHKSSSAKSIHTCRWHEWHECSLFSRTAAVLLLTLLNIWNPRYLPSFILRLLCYSSCWVAYGVQDICKDDKDDRLML